MLGVSVEKIARNMIHSSSPLSLSMDLLLVSPFLSMLSFQVFAFTTDTETYMYSEITLRTKS